MESTAVTPELIARAALEAVFLVALLGSVLVFSRLRKRLAPLGAGLIVVVLAFFGLWGAAQLLDRWQYDYPQGPSAVPLTRFAMYQVQIAESVRETYGWELDRGDGDVDELNIADEFESIGLPPLSTRMRVLLNWAQEPVGSDDHVAAEHELALYALGLVRAVGATGDADATVRFLEVTGTPDSPRTEVLLEWTVADLLDREAVGS